MHQRVSIRRGQKQKQKQMKKKKKKKKKLENLQKRDANRAAMHPSIETLVSKQSHPRMQ